MILGKDKIRIFAMENSSIIFELAPILTSTWCVKDISLNQSGQGRELQIPIDFERDELLDRFKDMDQAYKLKEIFSHFWNIGARISNLSSCFLV